MNLATALAIAAIGFAPALASAADRANAPPPGAQTIQCPNESDMTKLVIPPGWTAYAVKSVSIKLRQGVVYDPGRPTTTLECNYDYYRDSTLAFTFNVDRDLTGVTCTVSGNESFACLPIAAKGHAGQ
jgi:hypothetical protein